MKTTNITIKGLHCNSCKLLIEDVSKDIKGVESCTVDLETGKTIIKHDQNFNLDSFKKEVEGLGQYIVEINS